MTDGSIFDLGDYGNKAPATKRTDGDSRLWDEINRLDEEIRTLTRRKSELENARAAAISIREIRTLSEEKQTQMIDDIANEVLAS